MHYRGEKEMKSTEELFNLLQNLDIDEFKKEESFQESNISDYLNALLKEKNIQPKDIIVKLNMERSYTYQILKGRRKPTRIFLIRIALLCKLDIDATQRLLSTGNRPILYPRNRFDAAILYGIQHNLDETQVNELLLDIGEDSLI